MPGISGQPDWLLGVFPSTRRWSLVAGGLHDQLYSGYRPHWLSRPMADKIFETITEEIRADAWWLTRQYLGLVLKVAPPLFSRFEKRHWQATKPEGAAGLDERNLATLEKYCRRFGWQKPIPD